MMAMRNVKQMMFWRNSIRFCALSFLALRRSLRRRLVASRLCCDDFVVLPLVLVVEPFGMATEEVIRVGLFLTCVFIVISD